ncbi:hypothetical protein LguiB_012507 [Lonicera macranthoides]
MSQYHVEATRVLPEELASANHFSTLPSEYKMKAKYTMSYWFGMLASGPSPKGPEIDNLLLEIISTKFQKDDPRILHDGN